MLTDKQIKALPPKAEEYYETDDNSRRGYGRLAVKVYPSSKKVFYFNYTFNKKRKFLPLGDYPTLPLQTARKLADSYGQMVFDGRDPREVLNAEKVEAEAKRELIRIKSLEGSIGQLFDLFCAKIAEERGAKYAKEVTRALKGEALPILKPETKVNAVKPDDIAAVLRPILNRGSTVMVNRMRSYLHAAFKFALDFDRSLARKSDDPLFNLTYNVVSAIPRDAKAERESDRTLSESELITFWQLIESSQLHPERKILLKLLIVFGGRRVNEVIQAPWSEFDLDQKLWDRPASRDKSGRHVLLPVGDMACVFLKELQQYTGGSKYLFGDVPPTDYAINQTVRRLIDGKMEHFSPKCLRATAKTLMGKLGISKEARDRYHSHALHDVSSKHYDKYDYLEQNREVVVRWENFLGSLLGVELYNSNVSR